MNSPAWDRLRDLESTCLLGILTTTKRVDSVKFWKVWRSSGEEYEPFRLWRKPMGELETRVSG